MKGGVGRWDNRGVAESPSRAIPPLPGSRRIDLDQNANPPSQAEYAENKGIGSSWTTNRRAIVELFAGYQPSTSNSPSTNTLSVCKGARGSPFRNLKVIPSRFDFSHNLISAIRPDPQRLSRFGAGNFQDEDLIVTDCAPTESVFTQAGYHASRYILVPVRPEFFTAIGFPLFLMKLSVISGARAGRDLSDVLGIAINNATYDGRNFGGPETLRALSEIMAQATKNGWPIFQDELGHSPLLPKMMRGDYSWLE